MRPTTLQDRFLACCTHLSVAEVTITMQKFRWLTSVQTTGDCRHILVLCCRIQGSCSPEGTSRRRTDGKPKGSRPRPATRKRQPAAAAPRAPAGDLARQRRPRSEQARMCYRKGVGLTESLARCKKLWKPHSALAHLKGVATPKGAPATAPRQNTPTWLVTCDILEAAQESPATARATATGASDAPRAPGS